MKKSNMFAIVSVFTLILSAHAFAGDTHSGRAVGESTEAVSHAGASVAHGTMASGQVTSAASAVPLAVVGSAGAVAGSIGEASTEIARDLMEAATAPVGTPLEITEESVITGPAPNKALDPKKCQKE
ncbi:hypothetical protein JWG39_14400 [Desulforhopalus vacuolatus]|uniref:hypothetical protein n=1 Tax=Desulforhopalus vacuolatus TaxID=40414 RepID=UPI0019622B03|nr:hypothetical protein [Desulforhopalus vacuolatus]MBM9521008.1 hypothetical protein [Desulforhopalus vacuolatus]